MPNDKKRISTAKSGGAAPDYSKHVSAPRKSTGSLLTKPAPPAYFAPVQANHLKTAFAPAPPPPPMNAKRVPGKVLGGKK
ncbi:hypothetical protein BDZ89DRAFT_1142520 [Hymenopellis radicata]|nr:hypothetical protein BDZ89DRAFT_1142520 [Hymenopellis radicata]